MALVQTRLHRPALARLEEFCGEHADLLIAVSLTLVAGVLRFWALGDIPSGVHGDEAQVGMDAERVLAHGWIGVYTLSALGQPAGHAYLAAPFIELFGHTAFAVRVPFALAGTAAIPLAYVLFRLQAGRVVAAIAALLLAVSLWHIHFSRVAHWPITYPTVELLVLIFWTLAIQRGSVIWFALAGATLGLGLYTYNVYPIFVVAFAVWVALYTLQHKRGADFKPWAKRVALAAGVATLYGLPLFAYMADPANDYFNHYRGYYKQYSVLKSPAFLHGDLGARVDVIADQVERFAGAYAWHGVSDFIDGSSPDHAPMLGKLMVALFVVGVGYAAWNWRKTPHLMALTLLAIIPLTSILQTNSTYRGILGLAPFVAFFAALPLAWAWRHASSLQQNYRGAVYAGVAVVIALIGYRDVSTYYGSWAGSDQFNWVYTQEISEASTYLDSLPDKPYVIFYSGRWRFDYETREYLAPGYEGEDRSARFSKNRSIEIDRSRDTLFLLLLPYLDELPKIQQRYPGGEEHVGRANGRTLFIAYRVPPEPEAAGP